MKYTYCTGENGGCTEKKDQCTGSNTYCTGKKMDCTGPNNHCTGLKTSCTDKKVKCTGPKTNCTNENMDCTRANINCTGKNAGCTEEDTGCTALKDTIINYIFIYQLKNLFTMNFSKTIPEKLRKNRILINNGTNDPVISERMATAGYTPEEMQNGIQLLEAAEEAYELNHKEKGEYNEARDNRQEAKNAFHDKYIRDLEFTRIALSEDPKKLEYIGATGRRSRTQAAYLKQAKHFYSSIEQDENLLQKMARFGYTREIIKERLDDIEELYQLMEKIESEEGDAQHQIQVRNEKLDELENWTSVYKKVALLMFEDDAQYLEKLGIIVKS
ncbi:MAG: hypothetical protein ACLFM7_04780 [Bacteroidales bacterium]